MKSNWEPPVQPSVALETYLEEVKTQLAEIQIFKPKNNLPPNEHLAIKELKQNPNINIKKADKGTSRVIMHKEDEIHGQIQLDVEKNYKALSSPMVSETYKKVTHLIKSLSHGEHTDAMTEKWHSHKTRLVFQFSTPLQRFTNQIQLGDLSFRAVKALQNEYHLLRLPPSAYR